MNADTERQGFETEVRRFVLHLTLALSGQQYHTAAPSNFTFIRDLHGASPITWTGKSQMERQ